MDMNTPDITVERSGHSIALVTPETDRAREWFEENVAYEPWQVIGKAIAMDLNLAYRLVQGAQGDGLTVVLFVLDRDL